MLRKLTENEITTLERIYNKSTVGHKWCHIYFVRRDAQKFCRLIGMDYPIELDIAILFHDISLALGGDRANHEVESAVKFKEYAKSGLFPSLLEATDEELQDVMNIIVSHRSSKTSKNQHKDIRYVIMGMADRGFPIDDFMDFNNYKFNKLLECFLDREDYIDYTSEYCLKKYGKDGTGYNVFYSDLFTGDVQRWIDALVKKQQETAEHTVEWANRMFNKNLNVKFRSTVQLIKGDMIYNNQLHHIVLESMKDLYNDFTNNDLTTREFNRYIVSKQDTYKVWMTMLNWGLVTGMLILNVGCDKDSCEISLVTVNKKFRGVKQPFNMRARVTHTYGERLIGQAIKWAKSNGYKYITLYRDSKADGLRRLYESFGFKQVGRAGKVSTKMTLKLY